jgi:hypothetical protein
MIDWVDVDFFRGYYRTSIIEDDPFAIVALSAGHKYVRTACQRSFAIASTDVADATSRSYTPKCGSRRPLRIHDCTQIISVTENGVELAADQWQAQTLWGTQTRSWTDELYPYEEIQRRSTTWYTYQDTPTVDVVAVWGWPVEVPSAIFEATCIASKDFYDVRDVTLGVVGFSEAGAARVRENGAIATLIKDYQRFETLPGLA